MDGEKPLFEKGDFVTVSKRTHPGFNKQGGPGKVVLVNYEGSGVFPPLKDGSVNGKRTTDYTYNIKYILGGSERRVDAQWIQPKNPMETSRQELMANRLKTVEAIKERKRKEEEEKIKRWENQKMLRKEARKRERHKSKKIVQELRAKKLKRKVKKARIPVKSVKKENHSRSSNIEKQVIDTNFQEMPPEIEETEAQERPGKDDLAIEIREDDVKVVKDCIRGFLGEGVDEIGFEMLQLRLMKNGNCKLADDKLTLVNCLMYLDSTTFVFYNSGTEMIWVI